MKELFSNRLVIGATVLALAIAAGSAFYYTAGTRPPAPISLPGTTPAAAITGYGSVESAENDALSFGSTGRVTAVPVAVGGHVAAGGLVASLDTASLAAARDQAAAALAAAQAKLALLTAGPREVDLEQKKTAVDQATQMLATDYENIPTTITNAYNKTYGAVHADSDMLFDHPESANPELSFTTRDSDAKGDAEHGRLAVNNELAAWKAELSALDDPSPETLDTALTASIHHLETVQAYSAALSTALASAVQTNSFNASAVTTANANAAALRDTVNGLLTPLIAASQQIDAHTLAIRSAKDALAQAEAGATSQDVAAQQAAVTGAQAALDAATVALNNARVIAPFSGTVASIAVKPGDWVTNGTQAASLVPDQPLQVTAYFSEADAARLAPGDAATMTLDAYGNDRPFAAQVVSVDSSPSPDHGVAAYKVVLEFDQTDTAIWAGMSANVSITK